MSVSVGDLMQRGVVTIAPDRPLAELDEVLLSHRILGAPVVDHGRLVGIVSRSDVVRQLSVERSRIAASAFYLEPFDADDRSDEDYRRVIEAAASRIAQLHVRDVMIEDLVTVRPDATLQEIAQAMLDRRIHRVLVTEGGELRGIVSSLDLVGLFAEGRAKIA
jgi:CBS domain-containing protein